MLFALVTCLGLLFAGTTQAQVVSAGITGVVTDADGSPVSGAKVTAVHVPTNSSYTATTTASGRYNFRSLIIGGPWDITVSAPNTTPAQKTGVTKMANE